MRATPENEIPPAPPGDHYFAFILPVRRRLSLPFGTCPVEKIAGSDKGMHGRSPARRVPLPLTLPGQRCIPAAFPRASFRPGSVYGDRKRAGLLPYVSPVLLLCGNEKAAFFSESCFVYDYQEPAGPVFRLPRAPAGASGAAGLLRSGAPVPFSPQCA